MSSSHQIDTARILIVDDEAELREILSIQLQQIEFKSASYTKDIGLKSEIRVARDGLEALAMIEAGWFDAIITDINMPNMTGIELLAAIRGRGSDVPVIILTGYGDKAKSVEALRLGCFAFLDKPWKSDYLRRVVCSAVEQGMKLRVGSTDIESALERFHRESEPRRRQLRGVMRSLALEAGLERPDVCHVPERGRGKSET